MALMRDNDSRSARYLRPLISFSSQVAMFFIHVFKFFFPRLFNSSKVLHRILAWGLKRFVSPDANLLIFRHFHAGSEMIYKMFLSVLEKWQVKGSPSLGHAFDPNIHHAISKIATDDLDPGTIINELKKAFFYKDRLIRAAEVVVAVKAEEAPKEALKAAAEGEPEVVEDAQQTDNTEEVENQE